MGSMIFDFPSNVPDDQRRELELACVANDQDGMPYPSEVTLHDSTVEIVRELSESGTLLAPWRVEGVGQVMIGSATLVERKAPYHLVFELARGKVNQVRCQAADWIVGGLTLSDELSQRLLDVTRRFGRAIARQPERSANALVAEVLRDAFALADQLVKTYVAQVFQARHQRQAKLETLLSCRLQPPVPTAAVADALAATFNTVVLPFAWNTIEPTEGRHDWAAHDALVEWAVSRDLRIVGGPLIDFSGRNLPDWLWTHDADLLSRHAVLSDFVERVVRRYSSSIRTWQVTAGSNIAGVLAHRDDELLWLTVRMAEAVRRIEASLEVLVGLSQPWGEYLAERERNQSPFLFADTLQRSGLKLNALVLEVVMGVTPRGSYCRDPLDLSRLLDLYALLGIPLHVKLGYPSTRDKPSTACADQRLASGWWREGFTPEVQAAWAADFAALALCKPSVRAVHWAHIRDGEPHHFPACGTIDTAGRPKPVLHTLAALRAAHLK